jgi:tetratricopeptide (TPR) repeat protein
VSEGLAHAETAAKMNPNSANARLAVANALLNTGYFTQADAALASLRKDFPKSADVHAMSGILFDVRRDPSSAAREFDTALTIDPANVKALTGRVAIDIRNGRTADAQARMTRAVAVAAQSTDVLLLAARVDMSAGDAASAERRARRAQEIDPANLHTYDYLGRVYLRQNKLEKARVEFSAMAQRQPDSVAAKTMLALIYSVQGKLDESRKTYEDIVARNRNAAVAANNLAWMYVVRKERLDEALQLAQDAKQRLPERPEVNDTLGWVYYNKDLPLLAIPPLESCVEKAPKNPIYFLHLGLAYAKANQPQKARAALEQALKLNPNFQGADEARSALSSLKTEFSRHEAQLRSNRAESSY